MPAAWNHSAISWFRAAAPEMKNRTRPPNRARTLENTSLSNSACCLPSRNGIGFPSRWRRSCSRPTLKACLNSFSFTPPSAACIVMMRA
jgi:hypothetical protein